MARKPSQGGAGATKAIEPFNVGTTPELSAGDIGAAAGGAQHTPTYIHSTAEYVAVRKSDLREISEFGWLEEGAGAVGLFFFSGAFWLAVTLLSEHSTNLKTYLPWFGVCLLSMLFGVALLWIAHSHFKMRKNRIDDYFRGETK